MFCPRPSCLTLLQGALVGFPNHWGRRKAGRRATLASVEVKHISDRRTCCCMFHTTPLVTHMESAAIHRRSNSPTQGHPQGARHGPSNIVSLFLGQSNRGRQRKGPGRSQVKHFRYNYHPQITTVTLHTQLARTIALQSSSDIINNRDHVKNNAGLDFNCAGAPCGSKRPQNLIR